jgi:hypothetical protein
MASFPSLPGYMPTHDCTIQTHKKTSHVKQEKNINPRNKDVLLGALPRPPVVNLAPEKNEKSMSVSQSKFKNPYGADIQVQFEPVFSKLDKQVA